MSFYCSQKVYQGLKLSQNLNHYWMLIKDKFYYWTGVQLVIRVVFYGTSSLDRNINLTIGIIYDANSGNRNKRSETI